ncbi:MAG: signal peptidase I, partial [Polaromonas sp.]|nr:signal peptidase I [Polaromonas sp.]
MQVLTAFILAGFVGFAGAWYFGMLEGNFALLLFMATVVTGIYWLAERYYFLPQRQKAVVLLEADAIKRREALVKQGISQVDLDVTEARGRMLAQPWWLDWTAGLFPVIIAVFFLRSFLFE